MFGYIILRDIPKKEVQLDLSIFEIKGGFRGFALVPAGLHHVSVKMNDEMVGGFWCNITPTNPVVVKVFDHDLKIFQEPDVGSVKQYTMMAQSGAMNHALISVIQRDPEGMNSWLNLTSYIKSERFPPILNSETPMNLPMDLATEELSNWFLTKQKSRFEQALYDTHDGNMESFLEEFQYAFVRLLLNKTDEKAFNRWTHLLQVMYNAGERSVNAEPELFRSLIDVLLKQLKCLPNEWFIQESKIIAGASHIIEDMIDTGIKGVVARANEFSTYLKTRGIKI